MAAEPAPPAPMMPTKANCEPPLKSSTDSAQVCSRLSPDATDRAPKLMP